jgi:hypothetical protein
VILCKKLLVCVIKLHNCGWNAAQPALALHGAQVQGMSAADIAMWQIMRLGRAPEGAQGECSVPEHGAKSGEPDDLPRQSTAPQNEVPTLQYALRLQRGLHPSWL